MKRAACAFFAGISLAGAAAAEQHCWRGVCLSWREAAAGVELAVDNPLPAPIQVRLELYDLVGVTPSPGADALARVGASERRQIATLVRNSARFRWRFRWNLWLGDPDAVHDATARYRMPFGGSTPRRLSQGANGSFSHRGEHAFDFLMPVGTPILAARAGVVALVVDEYERGGTRKSLADEANEIVVLHADGSLARYVHLTRGAAISLGEAVTTGALLGRSGNTGYTTEPHLHFEVFTATARGGKDTLPIRFESEDARGFEPVEGSFYPPQAP